MFSIYGVTGRTFRGTLENLRPLSELAPVRHGRGIEREGGELGPEQFLAQPVGAGAPEDVSSRYQEATAAYRQMLRDSPDRGPIHHAYQIMSRNVATLEPGMGVETAWRFLAARGYGQAPVVDGGRGLVGMVSLADLLKVLNVDDMGVRDLRARTVAEVMTSPVVTTDPVSDVRRVARVLLDYDLTGIPVVGDGDDLVGIVTRGDILRRVINDPPLSLWA